MADCTSPEADIILIPAGESVEFFPLNRIDADLAFVADSWDSNQLFLVEPQLPSVTDLADALCIQTIIGRNQGGSIDQTRFVAAPLQAARGSGAAPTTQRANNTAPVVQRSTGGSFTRKKTDCC